jgi:hypothetical protein
MSLTSNHETGRYLRISNATWPSVLRTTVRRQCPHFQQVQSGHHMKLGWSQRLFGVLEAHCLIEVLNAFEASRWWHRTGSPQPPRTTSLCSPLLKMTMSLCTTPSQAPTIFHTTHRRLKARFEVYEVQVIQVRGLKTIYSISSSALKAFEKVKKL